MHASCKKIDAHVFSLKFKSFSSLYQQDEEKRKQKTEGLGGMSTDSIPFQRLFQKLIQQLQIAISS